MALPDSRGFQSLWPWEYMGAQSMVESPGSPLDCRISMSGMHPYFGHPNSIFFVDVKPAFGGGIHLESMAQFYKRFPCRRWPQLEQTAWVCGKRDEGSLSLEAHQELRRFAASLSRKIEQK